jgi:hypothetical protein
MSIIQYLGSKKQRDLEQNFICNQRSYLVHNASNFPSPVETRIRIGKGKRNFTQKEPASKPEKRDHSFNGGTFHGRNQGNVPPIIEGMHIVEGLCEFVTVGIADIQCSCCRLTPLASLSMMNFKIRQLHFLRSQLFSPSDP